MRHINRKKKIKEYESHTLSSKLKNYVCKMSLENNKIKLLDYFLHFIVMFDFTFKNKI